MPHDRPNRSGLKSKGVTLVEVVIAMAIILIVSAACIQVLQFNTRASLATLKRIQANQYLDQIHNHLQRSSIEKLEEHYQQFPQIISDKEYSAEAKIEKPGMDGSRKASLTVRWTLSSSENSVSADVTLTPQ